MELGFDLRGSRGEGTRDLEVCREDLIESAGFGVVETAMPSSEESTAFQEGLL